MIGKCCRCGKEAVLNERQECYECSEIEGIKCVLSPKVMDKDKSRKLWKRYSIVNIIGTFILLKIIDISMFYCIVYLVAAVIVRYLRDQMDEEANNYRIWQEPVLNLIVKVIVSPVLSDIISIMMIYFILIVIYGITKVVGKIKYRKNGVYSIQNQILENEKQLPDLNEIPQYFHRVRDNEYIQSELAKVYAHAEDVVQNFDMPDEMKEEVTKQIHKTGQLEFQVNNEVRFYYDKVVEQCMNDSFRWYQNSGVWVDELSLDEENGKSVINIPSVIDGKYTTKKLFELSERVRTEINDAWNYFKKLDNDIRVAAIFANFRQECTGTFLGEIGERCVAEELAPYEGQIIVLPNLRLEVEGESIESDFVLVSPYGIYVLEVKNLGSSGGYDLRIEKDGRWSKVYHGGIEPMDSPVHQNERHILYLEKYINGELGRELDDYLRVQGMVVIANDKVNIVNESDNLILRYTNVMSALRREPVVMKEAEMKQIGEILSKAGLPPKEYTIPNYLIYYYNIVLLMDEYAEWKEEIEKLREYVNLYREKVLSSRY